MLVGLLRGLRTVPGPLLGQLRGPLRGLEIAPGRKLLLPGMLLPPSKLLLLKLPPLLRP